MSFNNKLNSSWWALRVGLGLAAFLAGLDKFFNVLTNWSTYLSPVAERFLPVSGTTFMYLTGPIEMLVGLAILTRWTRIGSYVLLGWLLVIAVNLITTGGFYDLAVRDVEMAIAAYVLAKLTEVRQHGMNGSDPGIRRMHRAESPLAVEYRSLY